jgi:hypothetical protein
VVHLKGPSGDTADACIEICADEFEPFGPESQPGLLVEDLFASHITRHHPVPVDGDKKKGIEAYIKALDSAWDLSLTDELCLVIASDASIPKSDQHQAVAAALVYRMGDELHHVITAAGVHTPPEMERFALQVGLSATVAAGCQCLVVFSDSASAVESILDLSPHSGQVFSLDACHALHPWFEGDVHRTLTLWYTPSRLEWR